MLLKTHLVGPGGVVPSSVTVGALPISVVSSGVMVSQPAAILGAACSHVIKGVVGKAGTRIEATILVGVAAEVLVESVADALMASETRMISH